MIRSLVHTTKDKSLSVDCRDGWISMSGKSILSDPQAFFEPVSDWVDEYLKSPAGNTTISLRFIYMDTATVQVIFEILKKFRKIPDKENKLHIKWYFEFDDPELLEIGEIMESRLKLNFDFIEFKNAQDDDA